VAIRTRPRTNPYRASFAHRLPFAHLAHAAQRYSRYAVEEEERRKHVRARADSTARSAPILLRDVPRLIIAAIPVVRDAANQVPLGSWLRLALWLMLSITASYAELLGPWLIATATYLVWRFGFSDREAGEESAYTVFNRGLRALPGQLRAEDVQRDMLMGVGGAM
jgi:hypothetical protein